MNISQEEIISVIRQEIENYGLQPRVDETGFVIRTGDGIATIYGLSGCMSGELIEFETGTLGMAMNLEENYVGCVLLGNQEEVSEGIQVKRTGRMVEVPVGDALIGRVIDPLGNPLDGKGEIRSGRTRPVESEAPGVIERQPVDTPLQTGIMAIDSMIPIGRGQRELVIGDRQTGKTAIAIDTIINQKGKDIICIYVAIGQKRSSVARTISILEEHGSMDYSIIVSSTASEMSTLQYIAPYSGCAIAEEFMYNDHKDVLIVYDDLSKHAVAYRTMSLLLKRPPGREAYPGDVFYLHSRLLERAARLREEDGGGSITALPIVETLDGDVSAYIPTNIISITDGQIYLEAELFFSGQRPAVNVGLSVSRVGGSAQVEAMKKVAAPLRINLAQYRELAVFSQFGSELDDATQKKLSQGERLVETLKQPQFKPISMEDQVILLFAATNRFMTGFSVEQVRDFNKGLLQFVREKYPSIPEQIAVTGELSEELEDSLDEALEHYVSMKTQARTQHA